MQNSAAGKTSSVFVDLSKSQKTEQDRDRLRVRCNSSVILNYW